jgi:hypothetical protein
MSKYKIIKETVERISGITDLSVKNKKQFVVDVRFIYMKLCYDFNKAKFSLSECGRTIKRDHGTIIYGLKQAENHLNKDYFMANDVYYASLSYLTNDFDMDEYEIDSEIDRLSARINYLMTKKAYSNNVEYETIEPEKKPEIQYPISPKIKNRKGQYTKEPTLYLNT